MAENAVIDTAADGFRLPTDLEWEYAARGGDETAEWWPWAYPGYQMPGDSYATPKYSWYSYNSGGTTHPVGEKLPNALGLYDMGGNAKEWVYTLSTTPNQRKQMGGAYDSSSGGCSLWSSTTGHTTAQNTSAGFRVVCNPSP